MATLEERLEESRASNEERQKARCAPFGIVNPSTCGQGYSPQHSETSFDRLLSQYGFKYSHTTVVTDCNGDDYANHTYKYPYTDWSIGVSVLPFNRGVSIHSSRGGSGRESYFSPQDNGPRFVAYLKRKSSALAREVRKTFENHTLSAVFLYSGMADYWCGDGERWEDNKGCLFASYDHTTTLHDIVDALCEDFENGGDCDTMPEWITALDVREALLACLSEEGLRDYHSGALCEWAEDCEPCEDCEEGYCQCELPQVIFLLRYEA